MRQRRTLIYPGRQAEAGGRETATDRSDLADQLAATLLDELQHTTFVLGAMKQD